ncbi:MAG TPA: hypothetical protein PKA38_03165 [Candidatus Levybacteria bacterium]|nr:hypothetical protein [Candidatus Levybacteria bacterium]
MTNKHLTISWLYPELMSTYGDRGNIIVLQKRCAWREIDIKIEKISISTSESKLANCDLLFMGGAQDTQQEIVNNDLFNKKGEVLKELIEDNIPGLFICGAYQFLGKYYKTAEGKNLPGLGIFPLKTENPGEKHPRLIGNIVIERNRQKYVGFENHGGRTYLENPQMAFAKVLKGYGNNGKDKTEGIIYKNSIGTYLHGPILPKNPEIADWLIETALERKYNEKITLTPLDDSIEKAAQEIIINRA